MPADVWAAVEGALPKDYTDKARSVVTALVTSLEFERSSPKVGRCRLTLVPGLFRSTGPHL
jgi:hypothetical protein